MRTDGRFVWVPPRNMSPSRTDEGSPVPNEESQGRDHGIKYSMTPGL